MDNNNDIKGWVKLFRKVQNWEWWTEPFTAHLFIHCVIKANTVDKTWRGVTIKRGSFITSRAQLSKESGLTEQQVRTSLKRLISTSELTSKSTSKSTNKKTLITVINYDDYQYTQPTNQPTNQPANQPANSPQNNQHTKEEEEYNNNNIFVDDDAARACEYIKCENENEDQNENENDRDSGVFDDVEEHYKIFKKEISGETQTRVSYQQLAKEFDVKMQPTQLVEYLDRWMARVRADGRKQMTYGEYRRYFKNWFLQTLSKERERRNTPAPYTPTPRTDHRLNVSKGTGGYSFTFNDKKAR